MFSHLVKKIKQKKIIIGIVGLGYVGLPLARTFCKNKIKVFGFDTDSKKIDKLKKGISYINYFKNSDIKKMHKNFQCFSSFESITKCDAIILCLPTPIKQNKSPEMKYIINSMKLIRKFLRNNQILSLESTTYPGTSEEVILPYLKKFNVGNNFFLIYSPEREDPGNKKFSNDKIPKVVGGYTEKCLKIGTQLYKLMETKIIQVSSLKVAEMTKLLENIYRSVNIGLVNELKMLCIKMNINIFEIINAAKTKPFGFHAFYPGPGYGGHCIPIDPFLLSWKAKRYNFQTKFIELSGKINENMPKIICGKIERFLKNKQKKSCLIIGVAYKKNVDDMRESPSLEILENLERKKIKCDYYDPYIKEIKYLRKFDRIKKSIKLTPENIKKYDLIILATDHDNINYNLLKKNSSMVFDCRGRYSKNNFKNVQQI
jgi:UDP-N-acetyl-D-glucosamine dehydrogenase